MAKTLKYCKKCKLNKDPEEFGFDARTVDLKKRYCKDCISILNKENYERKRSSKIEQVRDWQSANKEKVKSYKKTYANKQKGTQN